MRRFLASAWFPFLMVLVMGGVTVAAYAMLKPNPDDVGNTELANVFMIAGWAAGPVLALVSFLVICILNLIRRIVRLRKTGVLHPIVVLIGIVPWLVFSWVVTDEPRYTKFAIASIEFVGRPLLWGSLVAVLLTIILSIPLLFSKKK